MHLDVCLGRLARPYASLDLCIYIYGICISLYCTTTNMYWNQYMTLLTTLSDMIMPRHEYVQDSNMCSKVTTSQGRLNYS